MDAGRSKPIHKAKLQVVLKKSPDFDSIMAQQEAEREGGTDAEAAAAAAEDEVEDGEGDEGDGSAAS